jgi:EAL domain-containing protein (putative c-di-GMP-specific phosphodiesterase class I)
MASVTSSAVTRLDRRAVGRSWFKRLAFCDHAFGLETVAEGVEEADSLTVLRAEDVDYAQGYHLGRPAPASS